MENERMKTIITLFVALYATLSLANPIDDHCPQHVFYGAPQIVQEGNNQYICRIGYALNYSYQTKTVIFVVEHIKKQNLVGNNKRKDDFREDPTVPQQFRSTLKDYQGSGYDRGHVAPAANFPYSPEAMSESFFLTNMIPQDPGNNRGIWKYVEEYTRFWADAYGEVYVVSGVINSQTSKRMGNNVIVPDYVWKIVIDPTKNRAVTFLFPNQKLDPKELDKYVTTIAEIEKLTNINISPQLPVNLQGLENVRANLKDW